MQSSYQKSAKDTLTYGVATFLTFTVGLVQLPLLTKTLGAYEYGLWSLLFATIGLVLPFTDLGLGLAMIRFIAAEKNKEKIQEGFYSVLVVVSFISLIISLAVIIFADSLAINFFDGAVQVVRIAGILILLSSVNPVFLSLIRTFQQIKTYSIFHIIENLGRIGVIAYLALSGHGILSILIAYSVVKFVILIILFFKIKSQIGIKRPNFSKIKEFVSFGFPTVPGSLGFWLVNLSDRYVISYFLGANSVGIYSAVYGLGYLPYRVLAVLTFVLLATLSQLYDEGKMNEVKAHLNYSLKYFLAIIIPFIFGATILGDPVLVLFTTSEIASEGRFILPLVALAVSLLGVYSILSHILILAKKTKVMALIWMISATLNIGLNILVVPRMGVIGAAITSLIAYLLVVIMVGHYSLKEFMFSIQWRFIIKSLVASMLMSLVLWLMAEQRNMDTIMTIVVGVIIYGATLVLLRAFQKEEVFFFRRLLRREVPAINPKDE
ncbi:flippase [Chloroflexota bacterium]